MPRALVLSLELHDPRYHGQPEWPPAPARLFQALVAGSGAGGLAAGARAALEWLESLNPPTIVAPVALVGQGVASWVPNNDLDAVERDPERTSEIRTGKWLRPRLLGTPARFVYVWRFDGLEEAERHGEIVCGLAAKLYQFGRGVDMAWATGELLDASTADQRLTLGSGRTYVPTPGGGGNELESPMPGSLRSLDERFRAGSQRFRTESRGKRTRELFTQSPRPRFRAVSYDSPPSRAVFALRSPDADDGFMSWPLTQASALIERVRNRAVERLTHSLADRTADVERVLVGRKANGADDGPIAARVRIVPLPSIGHEYVDRKIRRILVEVPAECPIRAADVHWAFSGSDLTDVGTGEVLTMLTRTDNDRMLDRFVRPSIRWRTVTAAGLPEMARRRRIEPARLNEDAKGGIERQTEEGRAASAVLQALRHAGVTSLPARVRVQREPFDARGERAEAFAAGTRFAKERLWHVDITFAKPMSGPLVIGDGRFLGLGVMEPVVITPDIHAFAIDSGLIGAPDPTVLARALRRAVMARVQQRLGPRAELPTFVSGHASDGSPAGPNHSHLSFVCDLHARRMLVVAPHLMEHRKSAAEEARHLAVLDSALRDLCQLRAGAAGLLELRPVPVDEDRDALFTVARVWESVTPYQVTRHAKRVGAEAAIAADLEAECRRIQLPSPRVSTIDVRGVPDVGLMGRVRLTFNVAVKGPILIGRSRYLGGGLFRAIG